ncbi:23S rRNA methylase leader peptide, partial [Dysosmobacter welbionis]
AGIPWGSPPWGSCRRKSGENRHPMARPG